jgi:hypothetical protein
LHACASQVAGTINREVTYREAFDVASRISTFIKEADGLVSLTEVQTQLTKDVEGTQKKHQIAFFVMKAACTGAAIVVVALIIRELDPCKYRDKDSTDCSENRG